MRLSASKTPISTPHGAHEKTQSAPASFRFCANGVKSDAAPGTTTTGMASMPISFASCSANSSSMRESGMSCAAKPTLTFFPPDCSLMKVSAIRLSHFEPYDVVQKISGCAGGNASRGHTPQQKRSGVFVASDSVCTGLYVAEMDALIMRIELSPNFLA